MAATPRPVCYRFDRAELQPAQHRLLIAGTATPLAGRGFELLLLLVERAGQLVTKDEILDRVWAGLVVEENNLQVQVSALRKLLGSAAIETVPGRGYRFVPKVTLVEEAEPAQGVRRSNLPRQLTSFVAREGRMAECLRLLDTTRLLTLTGVGGLGKTRLSLEMASACADTYADGVWFVDLVAGDGRRPRIGDGGVGRRHCRADHRSADRRHEEVRPGSPDASDPRQLRASAGGLCRAREVPPDGR